MAEKQMYSWEDLLDDDLAAIFKEPQTLRLLQFTGLKDKNGKEIYEGDVLKWNAYIEAVKWHPGNKTRVPGFYKDCRDDECSGCGFTMKGNKYLGIVEEEVIGDIYRNPELLK